MNTVDDLGGAFQFGGRVDRAVAAFIGFAAVVLVVAAVVEFVGSPPGAATAAANVPAAAETPATESAVPLHRLMPDATDDLGRLVRVDGTVARVEPATGFWVRDLRGNTIFIATQDAMADALVRGEAVRIVGRVGLVPPETARDRDAAVGGDGADVIVRDVELAPVAAGIERLER